MYCDTAPSLKIVRLGGVLGTKFGRVHRLAVNSPGEAVRALCANFPAFEGVMRDCDAAGIGWRVKIGAVHLSDLERINDPSGRAEIQIAPVVRGRKSGVIPIIEGVLLIAASFIPVVGQIIAPIAIPMGVALIMGGISQLLAPHSKTPNSNQASYGFSGAVNTLSAGMPVPICYGELIVGGAVISAGMTVDQVPTVETGVPSLSALVQATTAADGSVSYQLYASWQPAGLAIGYDVTIQGGGLAPVTLTRTTGTSVYYVVPSTGPYEVIVNTVESAGPPAVYGPGATVWSSFVGG
jgi:predicted phage tail protein